MIFRRSAYATAARSVVAPIVFAAILTTLSIGPLPGAAAASVEPSPDAVDTVRGEACAYTAIVGVFGGPQEVRGCNEPDGGVVRPPGPNAPASTDPSYSPHVRLPSDGSGGSMTATDPDGATAAYGPAVIYGGRWPPSVGLAPPSGPQRAHTSGSPATGTVTASADITLDGVVGSETADDGPGGFGPALVEGDSLHVECSATDGRDWVGHLLERGPDALVRR